VLDAPVQCPASNREMCSKATICYCNEKNPVNRDTKLLRNFARSNPAPNRPSRIHNAQLVVTSTTRPPMQVTAMDLAARLSRLGPIRSEMALDLGALEAPGGCMSVVFLSIVGTQSLLAWDASVTRHSIAMLHQMASAELAANRGYMVSKPTSPGSPCPLGPRESRHLVNRVGEGGSGVI
jgi:hypothetical protein